MMDIRSTTLSDVAAVDALLSVSYPVLLKADYAPSVLVTVDSQTKCKFCIKTEPCMEMKNGNPLPSFEFG